MKIVHLCLASWYTDGFTYQDNMLSKYHRMMGFDVDVIASTERYVDGKQVDTKIAEEYYDKNGIHVIRLAYREPLLIYKRVRRYRGLTQALEESSPDILFIHSIGDACDIDVGRYLRKHPSVRVFADCHADYSNSAQNVMSKYILHKIIRKRYLSYIDDRVIRYWAITRQSKEFMCELYGLDSSRVGILPLGGDDATLPDGPLVREEIRKKYGLSQKETVLIHGGKLNKIKATIETMRSFSNLHRPNTTLLIFGNLSKDIEPEFNRLNIENTNIKYIGWVDGKEIDRLFLASDLGVFPASQSAIWMQAVVCGLPCIFGRIENGSPVDLGGNVVYVESPTEEAIENALNVALEPARYIELRSHALSEKRYEYGYSRIASLAILLR